MTTVPISTAPDMTSDATFRTWGLAISNAMAAIGWVKVTDAAQINWATVSKPSAANTAAGYEIWGMDDTLQATAPVYLKIEYGSGGSSATYPGVWVTLGTGHNGVGALTGQVGTRYQVNSSGNTSVKPSFFSGSGSRLTMALWYASFAIAIFVERSHDNTGADTSAGVMLVCRGSQSALWHQYLPFSGNIPPGYNGLGCVAPSSGNGTYMTNVFMYPIRCFGPGELAPMNGCAAYFGEDIGPGQITATGWDGATHNFATLGATMGATPSYGGSTMWAVLYE